MSQFQVGTEVAIYYHSSFGGSRLSKKKIAKVRKDGKFFLFDDEAANKVSTTMWTPQKYNQSTARQSGQSSSWRSNHCEVWTSEHDAQVKRGQDEKARHLRIEKIKAAVARFDHRDPEIDALLDAIENTGLTAAKEEESK